MPPQQGCKVQVFARIRPTTAASVVTCGATGVDVTEKNGATRSFPVDACFAADCSQEAVFARVGPPLTEAATTGFHGCLLCYGQSGSGKTHTMMGPGGGAAEAVASAECGLIPRVIEQLKIGRAQV